MPTSSIQAFQACLPGFRQPTLLFFDFRRRPLYFSLPAWYHAAVAAICPLFMLIIARHFHLLFIAGTPPHFSMNHFIMLMAIISFTFHFAILHLLMLIFTPPILFSPFSCRAPFRWLIFFFIAWRRLSMNIFRLLRVISISLIFIRLFIGALRATHFISFQPSSSWYFISFISLSWFRSSFCLPLFVAWCHIFWLRFIFFFISSLRFFHLLYFFHFFILFHLLSMPPLAYAILMRVSFCWRRFDAWDAAPLKRAAGVFLYARRFSGFAALSATPRFLRLPRHRYFGFPPIYFLACRRFRRALLDYHFSCCRFLSFLRFSSRMSPVFLAYFFFISLSFTPFQLLISLLTTPVSSARLMLPSFAICQPCFCRFFAAIFSYSGFFATLYACLLSMYLVHAALVSSCQRKLLRLSALLAAR